MSEKQFVDGIFVRDRHPNTPEFVKMSLSIERAKLGNWLRARPEQYINIDIKEAKSGKIYAEVNDFVPDKSKAGPARAAADNSGTQGDNGFSKPPPESYDDDIPF